MLSAAGGEGHGSAGHRPRGRQACTSLLLTCCACCGLQGRMPECVTCYEHVVALQPASPEALANLASAYKDSGASAGG